MSSRTIVPQHAAVRSSYRHADGVAHDPDHALERVLDAIKYGTPVHFLDLRRIGCHPNGVVDYDAILHAPYKNGPTQEEICARVQRANEDNSKKSVANKDGSTGASWEDQTVLPR